MKAWIFLWLGLALSFTSAGAAAPPARDPLVGTWLLDRFVDMPDGADPIYPFGEKPVGLFIFTADGRFSFSVMRNPPEEKTQGNAAEPRDHVPSWFVSYFGTYRYNPADSLDRPRAGREHTELYRHRAEADLSDYRQRHDDFGRGHSGRQGRQGRARAPQGRWLISFDR
jgi:hypothetical protein